ncbi:unnamed protein product [Bathycoccus prasinos]
MSLPYVGGLAALGAAAAASSQGLVPTRMPSISDIPTDWTAVIDAFAKARDVLPATLTGVLGGAGVKEISDTNTTTTTNTVTFEGGGGGKNGFSATSALQVAALLSGAATGAIVAYYGTDKSLDKAKEFAIAFKKKAHLFDLWLKEVVTETGKVFVYVKTFTTKTFTMTNMGELKRIVSADKIYKAKDSVVVMITPTLIVVKNVAMNGVERATLFSKASYMKAMAFADTLVNKMNKKYEEQQEKKKKKTNKQQPPPPPKTKATAPSSP